ncbi:unnamed protein product [Mytilus edulis]|uniref:Uncharacterized protein n=1 Tax=Mytilus edulis TaxID=6550 RepID=A0A8S3T7Y4_MYTED|nr:unnamed protein product [Mytilus edulis]
MSAQLRRSARKRKNLPIVAAASARKKANQRVPDTMSVTAPQLPTVDTGTPFIPVTSSTGTYPMLFSQTGAVIYTSASTGPVDLTSTANTLLYSRVPPDQRECNTVTSQDPPEHSLGRLQELLKYMSVVRLGAKRNPNNLGWKLYDEQFRLRKTLDPASSWAIVDPELWLLYMADSIGTQNLEVVSSGYNTFSANRNVIKYRNLVAREIGHGYKSAKKTNKNNKKYEDPPKFLVVHVGANDLGNIKTKDLREKLIQAMTFISKDLPDTKIVWSQMLPRLKWRYSNDGKAMEKCRYRVNNAVANFILELYTLSRHF